MAIRRLPLLIKTHMRKQRCDLFWKAKGDLLCEFFEVYTSQDFIDALTTPDELSFDPQGKVSFKNILKPDHMITSNNVSSKAKSILELKLFQLNAVNGLNMVDLRLCQCQL